MKMPSYAFDQLIGHNPVINVLYHHVCISTTSVAKFGYNFKLIVRESTTPKVATNPIS